MYTLNPTAIGVKKGLNKRWQQVPLDGVSVQELIAQYRILQITLTPQGATDPVYLLLSTISATYAAYSGTFQDLLDALGNAALPTVNASVILDKAVARFYDVFKLRYQVQVVDATNNDPPAVYDADDYDHIRIQRSDSAIDSASAVNQVLANVNGFYHRTENIGGRGLFVRDALKSLRQSNQNQLGLWDFKALGGFTLVPTVPGAVHSSGTAFQVSFPQDVSQKTVFFVIAGYFFAVDGGVVTQNGPGSFLIDFAHAAMRLPARYFEAANYLDLASIAALAAGETSGTIDTTKLGNADTIAAWMALSQTFAVIINRQNCYVQSRYVQRTGNPNQYVCYLDRDLSNLPNEVEDTRLALTPPDLPLVLELGRQPPYWCVTERWAHSLTIYNNRVGELLYESGQPADNILTSGADQPGSPGLVQQAYLLEFGSDVKDQPVNPPPP